MEEGVLSELIFGQCFNYVNWSGSIKVPGILQYAKKCAKFHSEVMEEAKISSSLERCLYFVWTRKRKKERKWAQCAANINIISLIVHSSLFNYVFHFWAFFLLIYQHLLYLNQSFSWIKYISSIDFFIISLIIYFIINSINFLHKISILRSRPQFQ